MKTSLSLVYHILLPLGCALALYAETPKQESSSPLSTFHVELENPAFHQGFPDGSAGLSAGPSHFIAACDENNKLHRFSSNGTQKPVCLIENLEHDLELLPKKDGKYRETDLEGAARVGEIVYWIGSHGRNKKGEERKERQVLFATIISGHGEETALNFYGKPCKILLPALQNLELRKEWHVDLTAASGISPENGGLNIESLCPWKNGLLIGFRGPVSKSGALFVPLTNPKAVVKDGEPPALGAPFCLDLGGKGVRDMAAWRDGYLIVAGEYKDIGEASVLYQWSGDPAVAPVCIHIFDKWNPECIFTYQHDGMERICILSDDAGENFRSASLAITKKLVK